LCWRNAWADFTDLQRAALQLLTGRSEVSERLRAGARHILIDEFQDTNIAQWQLIDSFRSQDNVLIVGDGKQAIYQFRGGDITVFEEVQNLLLGDKAPDTLTISRRSNPTIVEFCNDLFRSLLPPAEHREAFEAEFQALESGRPAGGDGGVCVVRGSGSHEEPSQPGLGFADSDSSVTSGETDEQAELAQAVAMLLAEIQADADEGVRRRRPEFAAISEKIRRNEAGVIGLLFRTHARKAVFESALREHDVRFVSVKGIGFYQSQQVMDVINLASFCFDTADSLALAGVLRSPLVGLSDRALLELRTSYPEGSLWQAVLNATNETSTDVALSQDDWRALRLCIPRLSRWRERLGVVPFSAVLELVWRESELAFCDALFSDAPQRLENWRKIIEVLRDREERGHGSTREIVEFLSAQASEEENEADASLPGDSGSIQLMTVFAAKGLGFDMTVVAQTDGLPRVDTGALKKGAFPMRE
jgi:ATP-dependent helicase/nuclease subunit A